jgi:hypothetical protein
MARPSARECNPTSNPMACWDPRRPGRDAPAGNRRVVRPLRLSTFGARRAAFRRQPGHRPAPARRRHGGARRAAAVRGHPPERHDPKAWQDHQDADRRLRCHSRRDWPVRAVDPRRHADNRAQKGLVGMRTAIRSLEGARASPKPAAGRYAPPRSGQGSLRDPCGQALDRTSPAQIPAASGLGGGVVRRQNISACAGGIGACRRERCTLLAGSR